MKMVRERSAESYEALPSIDQALTFETAERIFSEYGLPLGRNQMESLEMVESGTFTNLAYMLSDQFPQGIKMAVYEDEYKSSFLDRSEATGCVLEQFQSAYEFVDKHNSKRSRIVGPRRVDSREYPEEAVRETIINAIAHRDYGINGDILISMYRDRMVVLSVGGLNTGIGLDDIMAGVSSRRNPNLAAVMYRLEMMETYGTGIPRIMGMYRDQPLKPRIEVTTNSFKVTLPKTLAEPLSEDALRVMESLGDREDIRRVDVESLLGVSKTRAMVTVRELEDAGLLERYGSGRETHYRPSTFVRGRLRTKTNENTLTSPSPIGTVSFRRTRPRPRPAARPGSPVSWPPEPGTGGRTTRRPLCRGRPRRPPSRR